MERDGSLSLGYAGYNFHTDLRVSDSFSKSGFFANAHGFEVVNLDKSYDDSRRDIDLPYQQVNHLKVISHTTWRTELWALEANLAYQNNLREEHSKAVAHGYMPQPENTLERRFNKSTFTGGLGAQLQPDDHHTLKAGISTEYQHNRRGGWGFVLPDFETFTIGGYCFDRYAVNDGLVLNGGVRYDFARTHIHGYHDWYATPVDGTDTYVERAQALHRHFSSITWSAGVNYAVGEWLLKANVVIPFRYIFEDDVELGSFNIEVHSNFDHHSHSTEADNHDHEGAECEEHNHEHGGGEPEGDGEAWYFNKDYSIPAGQKTYEAHLDIPIPANAKHGAYHFMVKLTDKAGFSTHKALSIIIEEE